jgi:hypothetical protein
MTMTDAQQRALDRAKAKLEKAGYSVKAPGDRRDAIPSHIEVWMIREKLPVGAPGRRVPLGLARADDGSYNVVECPDGNQAIFAMNDNGLDAAMDLGRQLREQGKPDLRFEVMLLSMLRENHINAQGAEE